MMVGLVNGRLAKYLKITNASVDPHASARKPPNKIWRLPRYTTDLGKIIHTYSFGDGRLDTINDTFTAIGGEYIQEKHSLATPKRRQADQSQTRFQPPRTSL